MTATDKPASGKWTASTILNYVSQNDIQAIWHWFVDIEGYLKGFAITPRELERSLTDGMHFDGSSISGFNAIEESDLIARPDLSTFADLPENADSPRSVRFFCDIQTPDGKPYKNDPRGALKRIIRKASRQGFTSYMGPEIEFFIFASMDNPKPTDFGGYFTGPPVDRGNKIRTDVITALDELGIPCEYHHHEVAESQHEIDLRYDEVLRIADAAITYKYVVKQVAHSHGVYATFMPKPIFGANGSGMHVHQSLFKGNRNAFANPKDKTGLSQLAKQYIAGLLKYAEECCSFWAPTVNSYKRLVPGYEAPVYIAWSAQNRSAMVRVPAITPGKEKSVRCELRCPDPSANPYLAFATMLGAGLAGIEENLKLEAPQKDNLYDLTELERHQRDIKDLPSNLSEALHHSKKSKFVRKLLGNELVENFVQLKYREFDEYRTQVTKWEMDRYFAVL
ncbi:glutamine synthetase [bacterium]|nr:glutamine synthetase [bacterium]